MQKENNRRVGSYYEERAIAYLEKAGYHILQRNYRCKAGEIDIVAMDAGCLCFIEVKYRSKNTYGGPLYAVDYRKQQRISKVALWYLKEKKYDLDRSIRFDVVALTPDQIQLVKNAFSYCY